MVNVFLAAAALAAMAAAVWERLRARWLLRRLDTMLDEAIQGVFYRRKKTKSKP